MKKLPKKLNILGAEYTISFKENLKLDDAEVWGLCDTDKKTIHINKACPKENILHVLIHEIGHAVLDRSSLHVAMYLPGPLEEVVVNSFAFAMTDLFKLTVRG